MNPIFSKKEEETLNGLFTKINPDEVRLLTKLIRHDPFSLFYKRAFIIYVIMLALILLWPFRFSFFPTKNNVKWNGNSLSLHFTGAGQVISPSFQEQFYEDMISAKGFSLEVWLSPANNTQGGPARIVSYSLDTSHRNFTLGQDGSDLIMRLRTDHTNLNGTEPHLIVENVFSQPEPQHIVVSYDFKEQSVFVDGVLRKTATNPGGNFNNWDPEYPLILGNEATGDRPWLGEIAYVAIYNRALDAREVNKRFNEVRRYVSEDMEIDVPQKGQLVRYYFHEKVSDRVSNSGALLDSMNLTIPTYIQKEYKPFLGFNLTQLPDWGSKSFYDIFFNILLFIPLGFLIHEMIYGYTDKNRIAVLFVMIVGFMITLSAEILQYFIDTRNSSSVDIVANWIGALLGIILKIIYNRCLIKYDTNLCNLNEN